MNQRSRTTGNLMTTVLLFGCSTLSFSLGITFLIANRHYNWLIIAFLFAAGSLSLFGSIKSYGIVRKELRILKLQSEPLLGGRNFAPTIILADWVYSLSEWKQFLKW